MTAARILALIALGAISAGLAAVCLSFTAWAARAIREELNR